MKENKKIFFVVGCLIMIIFISLRSLRETYAFDNSNIIFGYEITGDDYLKISENIGVIDDSVIVVPEMSIDDLINNCNSNGHIGVYDVEDNLLKAENLKTGNKLKVNFPDKTFEYKISVLGDLNGDGVINKGDATALSKYILTKKDLKDEYLYAGNIDVSNSININDVIKLVKYFNGDYVIGSEKKL